MSLIARIGLAASALVLASSAFAADLPSKKKAPVAMAPIAMPRAYSWNGVYGGVNGGFGGGNFTKDGKDSFGNPSGGTIGFTGGYNYQMPNNWVVGVEGDLGVANIKASGTGGSSEIRYMNTLRGRVGYAMDRTMPYLTAGYAGGTTHDDDGSSTADTYHNGWTTGGGVEMALTDNWTAKVEGLYVHLEEKSLPTTGTSGADLGFARIGLNYRF
jgi:outer membrane immunogenic protein